MSQSGPVVSSPNVAWPSNGISEVPFRLYTDPAQYQREQERIFKGPTWNYLCLAVELAKPGDYVAATVGETAVIEDDVSMLHDVTLGGTGKQWEDRHPKIRYGVMIGAGAKILGNIEIGHCARIAAGSVVLKPVPNNVTVAGVPARVVGVAGCPEPARLMDQMLYGEI